VSCVVDCSSRIKSSRTGSVLVLKDADASESPIFSICFSPNGKYLATGGQDRRIRVRLFHLLLVCTQD
jgi:WD40 repeat protein